MLFSLAPRSLKDLAQRLPMLKQYVEYSCVRRRYAKNKRAEKQTVEMNLLKRSVFETKT